MLPSAPVLGHLLTHIRASGGPSQALDAMLSEAFFRRLTVPATAAQAYLVPSLGYHSVTPPPMLSTGVETAMVLRDAVLPDLAIDVRLLTGATAQVIKATAPTYGYASGPQGVEATAALAVLAAIVEATAAIFHGSREQRRSASRRDSSNRHHHLRLVMENNNSDGGGGGRGGAGGGGGGH